jgi:hypothetical protein
MAYLHCEIFGKGMTVAEVVILSIGFDSPSGP